MKYLELKEQLLNEINMSPSALRRAAKEIGARAGMEFEMIVPGAAESEEGDDYLEPDYDSDESVSGIQDAYDFFNDGDYNGRRDVERLRDRMREEYQEWVSDQFSNRWDSDMDTFIYDYLKENANNDEIAAILGREDDDEDTKDNYGRKEVSEAVSKIIEQGQGMPVGGESWYDQAYESAYEDYMDEDREVEWLEDRGLNAMSDIGNEYGINWPHYYNPDTSGGDVSIADAADSFSRGIGKEVQASDNYHSRSVKRPDANNLHYIVEPDGSLEADEPGDGGLEFVSPALPIDELLDDLKKVKAWADKTGCYTNDSTGLHINVSVPAWQGDLGKLDYVKLAILMGDEYVLENFGRSGNTYAKSALKIVRDNITQRPEDVKRLLDQMKEHLNTSAAKLIHSGSTSKYTSVNTKDGYIEFRSPGGDWLNENFDKIETTLLRFVVAMDAAVDETKYKEEYAKKLYKLLAGDQKDATNTMAYFAKYAAGELPQAALKSFIKQAQFERKAGKEPNGKKMWYRVDKEGRGKSGASIEVVATSKEEALEKAASEWMTKLSALGAAAVYPVRPFDNNADNWEVYNNRTGEVVGTFKSVDPDGTSDNYDATGDDYRKWRYTNGISNTEPRSFSRRPRFDKNRYELFNLDRNKKLDEPVPINATTDEQALTFLDDYINHGPHGLQPFQAKRMIGIRRWGDSNAEPILANPIRATAGAPQPAGSIGRDATSPTGQWKMVDGLNRELYRFRPAENTRERANYLARVWATANNFDGNYQVEPVGHNDSTPNPIPGVTDIQPDITPVSSRLDRPFVWKVQGSDSPYQRQGVEVVANSEFEAMQKARRRWNLNIGQSTEQQFFRTNGWIATPVRPAEEESVLIPYKILNSGSTAAGFHARTEREALDKFNDYLANVASDRVNQFKLINANTGQEVSSPAPGSTTDLQQQRAQGGFTGAWKILDTDTGQELYRFSGIGNSQADANRVAADWLRHNGPEDANMTQIEVVPVMG
jgi:hypothetical protein